MSDGWVILAGFVASIVLAFLLGAWAHLLWEIFQVGWDVIGYEQ